VETLEESEERYRTTFENINDGIIRLNKFGKVLDINDRVTDMSGFARHELVGKNFAKLEVFKRKDLQKLLKQFGKAINGDIRDIWEWEFKHKNGTLVPIEVSPRVVRENGKIAGVVAVLRDITERKQTENALRTSESRYRTLFQYSADAISIHDGPNYIDVNDTWLKMFGYREDEVLGKTPFDFSPNLQPDGLVSETKGIEYLEQVSEGEDLIFEWRHTRSDGSEFDVEVGMTRTNIGGNTVHISFLRDITERKKAEDQINRRLNELRILQEVSSICLVNVDEYETISQVTKTIGKSLFPDHFGVMLLDEKQNVLRIHNSYEGISTEELERLIPLGEGVSGLVAKTNKPKRIDDVSKLMEFVALTKRSRSELCVPISLNGKVFGVINAESFELSAFTEADELLLTTVADQMALAIQKIRLYQSEKKRRFEVEIQHEISTDLANSIDLQSVLDKILWNLQRHFEFNSGGIILQEDGNLRIVATHGLENEDKIKNLLISAEAPLYQEMIKTKAAIILENAQNDDRFQSFGDIGEEIQGWMGVPLIDQGEVLGYVTFDSKTPGKFNDEMAQMAQMLVNQTSSAIAKAKSYKETQLGIKRLEALHEIDRIITSSVELSFAIEQIMQIVVSQLEIDAANVLMYDPNSLTFNPVNTIGFQSNMLNQNHYQIGIGNTGRVARERQMVRVDNLDENESGYNGSADLMREGFKTYLGVPLIAKGEIKGVLELFHRSELQTNNEWEGFLGNLAAQLAIAIDNSQMFENLQQSHLELTLSYESTIEGWAQALEMRDMETEGHSRRVVELTTDLAKMMGIDGQELAHFRRGALLHDIGKMAVSDAILQKPGKLTDEEWEIMRHHPTYAKEWLASTEYLKPALDIPYCHHEKWDGSGYPQGLEGEQIPLAARIFAIVDVWDALLSDRPYRKAWSRKETMKYIRDLSGKHFDPEVVAKFVELVKDNPII
jgi:PAS domain S-box-containing protein